MACGTAWLLAACSSYGPSAQFYYPIDELTEGLVYAYEGTGEQAFPPHFWYYRSVIGRDSTTLAATYYDAALEPRQFTNERIVSSGALRRDLRLYAPTDSNSQQVVATVLEPAVFSFEAPDPDRLLVSAVQWQETSFGESPISSLTAKPPVYTVTHNRRYLRDTLVEVLGERRTAQVWQVRELIEQDSAGILALEARITEVYADGLGLTHRRRVHSDGTVEAYRLVARLPMDSLVARAAE